MHLDIIEQMPQEHPEVLAAHIPYASDVERMGIHREPVGNFAPNSSAGRAYQALWDEVKQRIA